MQTRTLSSLPVNFDLYENYKRGGDALWNIKAQVGNTWRHSIRSRGGFWIATSMYDADTGDMEEMFMDGMMREIRAQVGGMVVWQGFLAQQEYTRNGLLYVRTWKNVANNIKAIYSRIGDNLFTNGSAESGAWASVGTPTTNAQSTTWVTDGTYSDWLITDAANEGATIQAAIAIVGSKGYDLRLSTNIVSGTWALQILRDDTGAVIAESTENTAGQRVMSTYIGDDNLYTGNITVQFICTTATGEAYGDGGVFQEAPARAETSWQGNTTSSADYGLIEDVLLEAGMSDAAANALVATELAERAWIQTQPASEFKVAPVDAPDSLKLTWLGYVFTLRNKYTNESGVANASTHVTNVITDSEFVTAGTISANAMGYYIDERAPLRGWEAIHEITRAGDASGARWNCGVYGGRMFDYNAADLSVRYRMRGGLLYNIAGGAMEPWFMLPGVVRMDDMIITAVGAGATRDDPRNVFIEEVEFSVADWIDNGSGLILRKDAGDNNG